MWLFSMQTSCVILHRSLLPNQLTWVTWIIQFKAITITMLQQWRANVTIHDIKPANLPSDISARSRIALNARHSESPFPSGSHDCGIAADCKLSRGTNFTLKTIDCSGLIRGFATINTIRIGAQIVYLDSVIIFWPRALTHSQNCTRCQKPRRERMQRVLL